MNRDLCECESPGHLLWTGRRPLSLFGDTSDMSPQCSASFMSLLRADVWASSTCTIIYPNLPNIPGHKRDVGPLVPPLVVGPLYVKLNGDDLSSKEEGRKDPLRWGTDRSKLSG
jgi:hypothetical protein